MMVDSDNRVVGSIQSVYQLADFLGEFERFRDNHFERPTIFTSR
jgi:hypothetical protein